MLALVNDPTSWITPSTLASGGSLVAFIGVVIVFMKYIAARDTQLVTIQDAFLKAIVDSRSKCDEAMKTMSERFATESRGGMERAVESYARVERALDGLANEVRAARPPRSGP